MSPEEITQLRNQYDAWNAYLSVCHKVDVLSLEKSVEWYDMDHGNFFMHEIMDYFEAPEDEEDMESPSWLTIANKVLETNYESCEELNDDFSPYSSISEDNLAYVVYHEDAEIEDDTRLLIHEQLVSWNPRREENNNEDWDY